MGKKNNQSSVSNADQEIPTLGSTDNAGNSVNLVSSIIRFPWVALETDDRFYLACIEDSHLRKGGLEMRLLGKSIDHDVTYRNRIGCCSVPWETPESTVTFSDATPSIMTCTFWNSEISKGKVKKLCVIESKTYPTHVLV